ncbi:bifunctional lysylphosphatidylglycerol flippase/synthetase MprF [Microbacterium hominis]|uniref:Phosphatidylglycerol lysyltransferase C-terminal domain-containing protein n=1 Tax=Microbacterium hominis TaxID=162426 RepID=A0A0B4CVH0_9MICO|nr:DUF2156 domain-containing protein [Microbacterium hominis]KIC58311.1 hypothetical protein RM52_06190 [Microbacterium hominis]
MTETVPAASPAPADSAARAHALIRIVRHLPATLVTVGAILVVGILSQGLWSPFDESAGMDTWAYGLPALEAGRWWTPLTGTFFVAEPWLFVPTLLGFVGMGLLEYARGTRVALAYFWIGQVVAVLATSLLLALLSVFSGWEWVQDTATTLDVGASGGTFACIAAVIGLLASPWRLRAWLVLIAVVIVGVLVLGTVADLAHLIAVLVILVFDRTLRPRRATVREQRLIAFLGMLAFVGIEVILTLIPTYGPFGTTDPLSSDWTTTAVDVVVVLVITQGLRRARRWAWVCALVLLALNILAAALLAVIVTLDVRLDLGVPIDGETAIEIGSGFIALVLLVYLIVVRGAFSGARRSELGTPDAQPDSREVADLIRAHGGGTLSWMTTWDGNSYLRTSTGIVAYQIRAGAAIALADPLGPEEGRAASVAEFIAAAEEAALIPCFFSAGAATQAAVPGGWRALVVADDTIVDLPGLAYTGKRWNSVRTTLNRAGREEMTFRLTHLRDESWGVRTQLQAISNQWVGEKQLPEMRFTLGTLAEADDPEVRIALALDARGDVHGFLSWMPVYGEGVVRGWTLDLMRRREHGFGPVMEYLIGSSAVAFRDEGAEFMSLSGAPLTHEYPPEAQGLAALSTRLSDALEPVYGFQSLHRFKQKFHPRYETMSLLFRDEADLPRIGAGLTRAFLPSATTRQFASAGLELLRGER